MGLWERAQARLGCGVGVGVRGPGPPSFLGKERRGLLGSPGVQSVFPKQPDEQYSEGAPGTARPPDPLPQTLLPALPRPQSFLTEPHQPHSANPGPPLSPSLHDISQGCWAQLCRLCTLQGHLVQGAATRILDLYIYSNFPHFGEGAPVPIRTKAPQGLVMGLQA